MTHCVVGKHLPRLFKSNRKYHREFWDWLPQEEHDSHLRDSQYILKNWLGHSCNILIPPGNVYSEKTVKACSDNKITAINSSMEIQTNQNVSFINEEFVDAFHDREIVLFGKSWLFDKINYYKSMGLTFSSLNELH